MSEQESRTVRKKHQPCQQACDLAKEKRKEIATSVVVVVEEETVTSIRRQLFTWTCKGSLKAINQQPKTHSHTLTRTKSTVETVENVAVFFLTFIQVNSKKSLLCLSIHFVFLVCFFSSLFLSEKS